MRLQDEMDEKEKVQEKNIHLESELKALKKLEKSVQKIDRSKKKLEQEFMSYKVFVLSWLLDHTRSRFFEHQHLNC